MVIVNIELEKGEDFAFIKQIIEKIKGVKSVSVEEDECYEDGTPKWFIDKIADYADRLEEKDMISEEEFFSNARKKSMRIVF